MGNKTAPGNGSAETDTKHNTSLSALNDAPQPSGWVGELHPADDSGVGFVTDSARAVHTSSH